MNLSFASVGVKIYGFEYIEFDSLKTLADYDVIIFEKNLSFINDRDFTIFNAQNDCYLKGGKTKKLLEYSRHWKGELEKAFKNGKIIFVNLSKNEKFFIYGTNGILNYKFYESCIPIEVKYSNADGTTIKSTKNKISYYMDKIKNSLKDYLQYKCILDIENNDFIRIFENKIQETVGAYKINSTNGLFILFPFINLKRDDFYKLNGIEYYYNELGEKIGLNLQSIFLDLHKYLKVEIEPLPEWILKDKNYSFVDEQKNNEQIENNKNKILKLEQKNELLSKKNKEFELLKYLIVGTGKQLENAVNYALKILGLQAENYENPNETLEIDCLIKYKDKIFIGEVEGKEKDLDNTKINQVISHINDYYSCEMNNIGQKPKGILFGNPQKSKELEKRTSKGFTDKCIKISISNDIPLVLTRDLFFVVKYVKDTNDEKYAEQCIKSILETKSGIVQFPELPILKINEE